MKMSQNRQGIKGLNRAHKTDPSDESWYLRSAHDAALEGLEHAE
jgi:hypothetical protein